MEEKSLLFDKKMNLATALKAGIFPNEANPIDIILTAHAEGLEDLLNKQIPRHHQIMRKARNVKEARDKFQVICDFSERELASMRDLDAWNEENVNLTDIVDSVEKCNISYSIMNSLRRKKIHRPVDDNMVSHCYTCNSTFTIINRRHHCRACGRIFCYNCSQWSEVIPPDLISYTDTRKWIIQGQSLRVCQSCKDMITNFRRIEHLLHYFEIVAFPFDLCVRASTLSRDWREAMRIYLSNVRDIQYMLPSTNLTERDKRALKSNLSYFVGHSKWILQALKLGLHKELVTGELSHVRIKSCANMMCDKSCHTTLTPFDAIIILNTPMYNVEVKLLALQILERTSFPPDIGLFLPMEDVSVQEFILKRSDLFLDFFWLSRIDNGLSADVFKNKLMLANANQAHSVQESIHLISVLENCDNVHLLSQKYVYLLSQKLQSLQVPFMGPFGMIDKFDSDIIVKHSATRPIIIKYFDGGVKKAFLYKKEDVRKDAHVVALIRLMYHLCDDIFSNCHNGVFLPVSSGAIDIVDKRHSRNWFACDSPGSGSYKHPSSLPTILQTSPSSSFPPPPPPPTDSLCNSISDVLSTTTIDENNLSEDMDFLATYRVMPITADSGFIEIVPDALTLSDILDRGTISNYLYRSNIDKSVREVSSNYSASLAFWTVVTYLLGVGDRHLENIMIREDGILFHIDYGFVFGADTTASFVRLDKNLIEGLGGSEMYKPFKDRCCEIYCCLRRHFSVICACLLRLSTVRPPIKGYNFTSEYIEKFISSRFLLGQTEEEAKEAFCNAIDSSRETLVRRVSDVIHSTMSTLKIRWWSQ